MDNTFAKNSKHNAEKKKEEQSNMKQGMTTRLNAYKERIGKLCDRLEDLTEDLSVLYDDVSEEAAKQGFVKVQSAGAQKKASQIAEELRKKGVPGFGSKKETKRVRTSMRKNSCRRFSTAIVAARLLITGRLMRVIFVNASSPNSSPCRRL